MNVGQENSAIMDHHYQHQQFPQYYQGKLIQILIFAKPSEKRKVLAAFKREKAERTADLAK